MTYRPRMVRENEAYGWLPEDEAYGRVSNVPTQPNRKMKTSTATTNLLRKEVKKNLKQYQEDIPLIVKYRDDFGEKK